MRLIITGKTQSGKSTALHRLTRVALQSTWGSLILADGKGVELTRYASANCRVFVEADVEDFTKALTAAADRLAKRYQDLAARKLTTAPSSDPRELIIIDEVQEFTRHPKFGKHIRTSLIRLFERSGSLNDVIILTSQRATGAIPPSARYNASAQLHLLGSGFYQLTAPNAASRQGQVSLTAPLVGVDKLTPEALHLVLSQQTLTHQPTNVTRYEGLPGSGRTYALEHHLGDPAHRRIYIDVKEHTHRSMLIACLQACGATPPESAPIAELAEAAALALQSRATLLLIDNVDAASAKAVASINTLLDAASCAAVSMCPADPNSQRQDPLMALRRRAALVNLQPLNQGQAARLLNQIAPNLDDASKTTIIQSAHGHPQTICLYAERIATHGDDERHQIEPVKPPAKWLSVLMMFCVLVAIILIQRHIANDIAGAVLSAVVVMTMWYLRPRFREATKK